LKKIVKKENFKSLALPRLATGVGGLDWDQVKPLIQSQLGELDIPVYVYVLYRADQEAEE
jgi:O-acetyl-ADP-ribose deacetylase (regulator of RNase III)|tara:strand:+ start:787 stop:966 length:180 start_codon:yes stop_codon:yes gene_type:complete